LRKRTEKEGGRMIKVGKGRRGEGNEKRRQRERERETKGGWREGGKE
jgi:hypothetical protein